jgi:hypothetical protein
MHTNDGSSYDPTKSLVLRNTFSRKIRGRAKNVHKLMREAIIVRDCFGLSELSTQQLSANLPGYRQFAFENDSQKIEAFIVWLRQIIRSEIIDMRSIGNNVLSAWTSNYIMEAYRRGINRARSELRKAGFDVPDLDDTGGAEAAMKQPSHSKVLDNLAYRMLSTLEGAMTSLEKHISMVLSDSLQKGHSPEYIVRRINGVFTGKDRKELGLAIILFGFVPIMDRLDMIARSEIVRAIAESALAEYGYWGVEEVGLMAEWVTAGDDRVCPRCRTMSAQGPYNLQEAAGLIPFHPLCRCFWRPISA